MASGKLATKYGKSFADKLGITGEFGVEGVDDVTARNAFHKFMSNPDNENTGTYAQITHELFFWHSLSEVRKLEHWLGFGIRPPKHYVDLVVYGYEKGSTLPKYKSKRLKYEQPL